MDILLATWIEENVRRTGGQPLTVGLCGSQGSGKTTMMLAVKAALERRGRRVAALSLDDFYLTRTERSKLAATVHPLLRTRGVPGTHDVPMILSAIRDLRAGRDVMIPVFDKADDDRRPQNQWTLVPGLVEVIIFEGWCIGAGRQSDSALSEPVNELERYEDPLGTWRRYVNSQLAGPYRALTDEMDRLVLLMAPSFDVVYDWRLQQEDALREVANVSGGNACAIMSGPELTRFISHYERLTRHILLEMPARADLVLRLDSRRQVLALVENREGKAS